MTSKRPPSSAKPSAAVVRLIGQYWRPAVSSRGIPARYISCTDKLTACRNHYT